MAFDIFNPCVSKVADSLKGKVVLIYGANNTGKTTVGTQLEKPLVLALEKGLNAINGQAYIPINNWLDFTRVIRDLTKPSTLAKAKEMYQTIVVDQLENVGEYAKKFICDEYNVRDVSEGKGGFGYWGQLNSIIIEAINQLTSVGYTVYFIDHEKQISKDSPKVMPSGESRVVKAVVNLCDIVGHVVSNGVDKDFNVINSSCVFADTDLEFGRTKFSPYMETRLENFTAENFEKCVKDGIDAKAKAENFKTVKEEVIREQNKTEMKSYEELMTELGSLGNQMQTDGYADDLKYIVSHRLGEGNLASDLKKGQEQMIATIIDDIKSHYEKIQTA